MIFLALALKTHTRRLSCETSKPAQEKRKVCAQAPTIGAVARGAVPWAHRRTRLFWVFRQRDKGGSGWWTGFCWAENGNGAHCAQFCGECCVLMRIFVCMQLYRVFSGEKLVGSVFGVSEV